MPEDSTDKKSVTPQYKVSSNPTSWYERGIARWRQRSKQFSWSQYFKNYPAFLVIGALLISAAVGFGGGWLGAEQATRNSQSILSGTSPQKQVVTSTSQLISSIAKTVGPSVVSVNVTSTAQAGAGLFGFGGISSTQQSEGTGIILSADGLIITNRHVVPEGTTNVSITLSDGTQLTNVSVIGRTNANSSLDVAFLKVNDTQGKLLIPAHLGDSSTVQVGDEVVAIGNALGQFQNTVTAGIISGYGRSVQAGGSGLDQGSENLEDLFQTDAAINEGNSGGPLVNMSGEVIGINTAIAGNAQNIGFAIPINDVKGLIQQATTSGKLEQPYLGVYYIPITQDVAQRYKLKMTKGDWIPTADVLGQNPILANGPADKAGLQAGDIVTRVDSVIIDQNHSIASVINQDQVGQTVTLTIVRNEKTIHLKVTLETAPTSVGG